MTKDDPPTVRILRVRNAAIARGDRTWVDICNAALEGDVHARLQCIRADMGEPQLSVSHREREP